MKRSVCALGLCLTAWLAAQEPATPGYTDTPMLPGQKWHVHDPARPHPPMVTPASTPGGAPSDAIVLFDGKNLSKWAQHGSGGALAEPKWKVEHGYFEVDPNSGDLFTRESFGDSQIHVEWSEPADVQGSSQGRGNSGVYLMSRYEIQVLDSFHNVTYADGQAGGIYGQWPPLVNPIRPPGEWNVYDLVVEAPKFEGTKLVKPGYVTLLFNGVLAHVHRELDGSTGHRVLGKYEPHGDAPLLLQDHGMKVRYRNIWIRRVAGYDQPER
jgi:hypothetical protein